MLVAWIVALCCLLCGCQQEAFEPPVPTYAVCGQILVEGQPAAGAEVVFHPEQTERGALRPRAVTDEQGRFELSTFQARDGAPAGRYQVTVSWKSESTGKQEDRDLAKDRLPSRYLSPAASKLAAEVQPGANELPPFSLSKR
jgi:hypothetical protein